MPLNEVYGEPERFNPFEAPPPKTVSPEAQRALRAFTNAASPLTLEAHRALCAEVQRDLGGALLARHGVTMEEGEIAGVPVRTFTPAELVDDAVLLNLHGGAFTVDAGSVTENAPIAGLTGRRVVAARYRLAPEHAFPDAVDDAEAVYRALIAETPPERVVLYGTSAGACLCVQLLARLVRQGAPLPRALGFFSGTADLTQAGDSEQYFRPPEDPRTASRLFATYLQGADRGSPEVSAILGPLGAFPPTLCIAGTRDFMLSQTGRFHRALLAAGVEARLEVFEAMPHAHWIFLDIPEAQAAFASMSRFFRQQLDGLGGG